jgi:two-component system chemotaxis response regulator CheY
MTLRALLIDDSRAMRILLGNHVRNLGFEVTEAENGREALALLSDGTRVDFALVDWNMPVMNGLEFIRAVRGIGELSHMRLLVVTSETEADKVMAAMRAGADEYLMKPFSRDSLSSKLEMLGLFQEPS